MKIMKYRLKRELPDYKPGEIFEWKNGYYTAQTPDELNKHGRWPKRYVEDNPDWFEPGEERIKLIIDGQFNDFVRKSDQSFFTDKETKIMEQARNGELFNNTEIQGILKVILPLIPRSPNSEAYFKAYDDIQAELDKKPSNTIQVCPGTG